MGLIMAWHLFQDDKLVVIPQSSDVPCGLQDLSESDEAYWMCRSCGLIGFNVIEFCAKVRNAKFQS